MNTEKPIHKKKRLYFNCNSFFQLILSIGGEFFIHYFQYDGDLVHIHNLLLTRQIFCVVTFVCFNYCFNVKNSCSIPLRSNIYSELHLCIYIYMCLVIQVLICGHYDLLLHIDCNLLLCIDSSMELFQNTITDLNSLKAHLHSYQFLFLYFYFCKIH